MKQLIIITLLALLNLTAYAQVEIREMYEKIVDECRNSNTPIFNYDEFITSAYGRRYKYICIMGTKYRFEPKRDAYGNIIETAINPDTLKGGDKFVWDIYNNSNKAISQIEHLLENSRNNTDKLYWWETHLGGKDTIMVSLAYKNRFNNEHTYNYQGHTQYESAEVADYSYYTFDQNMEPTNSRLTLLGSYSLSYHCLLDSVPTVFESFDAEGYKQFVLPLLQDKRIKQRPVLWTHDETCEPNALENYTSFMSYTNEQGKLLSGDTRGTIYTLKAEKAEDEVAVQKIMEQFLDKTNQYIAEHPEQDYNYHPNVRVSNLKSTPQILVQATPKTIKKLPDSPESLFSVMVAHDNEGYHILLLQTEGTLWIPRHFSVLKSIHNDKEVFLKGKEKEK